MGRVAERIPITYTVHICRDPKDNMFLELAVNGSPDFIVTGARDLLALEVFQQIQILTPASFVDRIFDRCDLTA